ncbi:hypothetical protein [Fibrella aquatilis]|uniref:Lipocalin-like domain-containing protein n=1 Tax=Fibrella aquatilis TaxID=2817059 RepID=A0A939G4N5_9BACT|nr:hypothetical protein [Fibrella aquatilis]MBO0931138.1 hypothetical protein [Fibrella aquatilis]
MKRILLILIVLLPVVACKKTTDVAPQSPAVAVLGNYKLSSFTLIQPSKQVNIQLDRMPINQGGNTASGTVVATKGAKEGFVNLKLTLIVNTQQASIDLTDIEVKQSSGAYGLYDGSERVGDATGSNIIFNLNDGDDKLAFVADK